MDNNGDDVNRNKTIFVLLMLVAGSVCGCIDTAPTDAPPATDEGTGTDGAGIIWYSYEEGMGIAQEQKKPVMIDIYGERCGYCDYMDENTFTDPGVIELADQLVCIKVSLNKEGGRSISARYGAYGTLPIIVFLQADGTKVHQSEGPKDPDPFTHEMMVALSKV